MPRCCCLDCCVVGANGILGASIEVTSRYITLPIRLAIRARPRRHSCSLPIRSPSFPANNKCPAAWRLRSPNPLIVCTHQLQATRFQSHPLQHLSDGKPIVAQRSRPTDLSCVAHVRIFHQLIFPISSLHVSYAVANADLPILVRCLIKVPQPDMPDLVGGARCSPVSSKQSLKETRKLV